jgi:hypothetical protein
MDETPPREFGRRRPVVAPLATPPVKRSGHVALLLMGTIAAGGGAYALMPRENCTPPAAGTPTPATSQGGATCAPRPWSGGGHGGSWSHTSLFSSDSSSGRSSSGTASDSGGVTRGGFGSFARAVAGHFSRGS